MPTLELMTGAVLTTDLFVPAALAVGGGGILSVWVVAPLACVMLLILHAHMHGLSQADMPESRRRIRKINAGVMMFVATSVAFALGVPHDTAPRIFVVAWLVAIASLGLMLMMGVLDAMNNVRLHRAHEQRVREQLADALERATRGRDVIARVGATPADDRSDIG